MPTGFGIGPLDGQGLTPASLRQILRGWWSSPGVVRGAGVTLTSGLNYQVAQGIAVVSRGDSDGYVLCEVPATTVATGTGPASGSRVDRVWVRQHDNTQGDSDNVVEVGITQGTAASNPSAPSIPVGALELTRVLIPQGATATSAGSYMMDVIWAIPYGVPRGLLWHDQHTFDGQGDATVNVRHVDSQGSFNLPTDRYVTFETQQCISTWPGSASGDDTKQGSILSEIVLDGQLVSGTEMVYTTAYATHEWRWTPPTPLQAGTHTIAYQSSFRWGYPPYYHFVNNTWPGRLYMVHDAGISV